MMKRQLSIGEPIRTRWSMIAFGILAFITLWQMIGTLVLNPIHERRERFRILSNKKSTLDGEETRWRILKASNEQVSKKCLSGDPAIVVHRYQEWLLHRTHSIDGVSIVPATPIVEGEIGWRISFNLEGTAPVKWIAEFVDEINRTPLNHRIRFLDLHQAERNSELDLDFSMTLEALAIHGVDNRDEWPVPLESQSGESLAHVIQSIQPFSRGYNGPPPAALVNIAKPNDVSEVPETPKVDPLQTLRLVGSVVVNGVPQAWIVDSRTGREILLAQNQAFAFDSFKGIVKTIDRDFVDFASDEFATRWPLGATLRSVINQ